MGVPPRPGNFGFGGAEAVLGGLLAPANGQPADCPEPDMFVKV